MVASAACLGPCNAAATDAKTPRHAGKKPMITSLLPGPSESMPGKGCTTLSVVRAAGPVGMRLTYHTRSPRHGERHSLRVQQDRHLVAFRQRRRWNQKFRPQFLGLLY